MKKRDYYLWNKSRTWPRVY